ncbi:hypothetical protein OK016_29445 [Vibrio chagasii]|nr:hypothetical protein [Vibrio chagasii]
MFLAAVFLSPLAGMIPAYATSGALIYVAFVMTEQHAARRLERLLPMVLQLRLPH